MALLARWQGYFVVAAELVMLLLQGAYELAPLPASYPGLLTTELLGGIALGVAVLGGRGASRGERSVRGSAHERDPGV